jgi:hypothetical protein
MTYNPEPEIANYLKKLSGVARDLPRGRRRELVAEIEQHIRDALVETPVHNEAEMLTVLDRIGDPDEIVAAAGGTAKVTRSTTMETWAIVLLLLGGFLWFVGWIAGVVLLWSSSLWTTRDKLIGTFVVPGGLAAGATFFLFAGFEGGQTCFRGNAPTPAWTCTGGPSTLALVGMVIALVVLVIGPIGTSIYLGRRLNQQKRAYGGDASAAVG